MMLAPIMWLWASTRFSWASFGFLLDSALLLRIALSGTRWDSNGTPLGFVLIIVNWTQWDSVGTPLGFVLNSIPSNFTGSFSEMGLASPLKLL